MNIEEYNYDLPEKFIAQTPLSNRSDSKLLLLNNCLLYTSPSPRDCS